MSIEDTLNQLVNSRLMRNVNEIERLLSYVLLLKCGLMKLEKYNVYLN